MMQLLSDLYEVEFNKVRHTPDGYVVTHDQDSNLRIVMGSRKTIVVAEPYILPLSKYGGGIKTKTLIERNCCWMGSVTQKVTEQVSGYSGRRATFAMVDEGGI